jgi:outer membrane protein assembly factor BamB
LRAGFGAVFTTAGKFRPSRLHLEKGKAAWTADGGASLLSRWREDLLAFSENSLRCLDPSSGETKWERACLAGNQESFVLDDLLVGKLAEHFHVIDLNTFEYLWKVPELASNPLVSDGTVLIRADDDVTCFDLRTGVVRWSRAGAEFGGKCWQMGFIWRDWFLVRIGEPLLLTALELSTGKTVWRTDFPVQWCEPYGDRAYGVESTGIYRAIDLATGSVSFEIKLGDVPEPRGPKAGLMVSRPSGSSAWRGATVAVSDSHAFVSKPSGQIVALGRETGEVQQIVEIDGMPASLPVIYENRLLLTDFNAAVYCFEGAP